MKYRILIVLLGLGFCSAVSATPHTDTHFYLISPTKHKVVAIDALTEEKIDIPVGQSPKAMEIYKGKGYVVNSSSNDMSIIDLQTHTVIQTLPVGRYPAALMIYDHFGYILNRYSKKVTVVDLDSLAVIQDISVGSEPNSIIRDGHKAYVTHGNFNQIIGINLRTNLICDRFVTKGNYPYSLKVYGRKGYVCYSHLNRIDGICLKRKKNFQIKLDYGSCAMVVDKDKGYVLHNFYDIISVIDLKQDEVIQTITVGKFPISMVIHRGIGYVLNEGPHSISVIDLEKGKVLTALKNCKSLSLNCTNTHLYLGIKQICPLFPTSLKDSDGILNYVKDLKRILPDKLNLGEVETRQVPVEPTILDLLPLKDCLDSLKNWEKEPFAYLTFLSMLRYPERIIQSNKGENGIVATSYRYLILSSYTKDDEAVKSMAILMVQLDFPYIASWATYQRVILANAYDGMCDS